MRDLEKSLNPLCKTFGLPVELAVVSARLSQGDFKVINDY